MDPQWGDPEDWEWHLDPDAEPLDLTGYQGTPRQEYVDLFRELGETLHVMTRQDQ